MTVRQFSISDYYMMDREIERKNKKRLSSVDSSRLIKIGLLGSFTLKGIKEVLNVKCDEAGLAAKFYVGQYNQYNQDLLGKGSGLYVFNPDITVLFLDLKDLLGEHYHFPYRLTDRKRRALVREKAGQIVNLAKTFVKNNTGKLVIKNFSVPTHSTMGILENKQEFGFFEMVRSLNRSLEESFRSDPQLYVFDYDNFLSMQGKLEASDDKMRYIADMKLSQNLIPSLCDEYMRYIKAIKGRARKCIVLDLDNTLWGGIVGEDGFDGIKLGPTPPGNVFVDFQKYLVSLSERGVILAINSSNNQADAMKVINEHPYMVLREKAFAAIKINWDNKPDNMVAIAKELNIGLESLLFIDDDKRNRQLMKEALPQVMVLDLPDDPTLYLKTLKKCTDLEVAHITEEDKRRGLMYVEERKRKDARQLFADMTGFLTHLNISVSIARADSFSMPRISQLTQRTNQFNFTTKRYGEEDLRSLIDKEGYEAYAICVEDRFGDSGISGAMILKKTGDSLVFNNFLMSCRVLGRSIEKAIIGFCVDKARRENVRYLLCEYIPSEKNALVRNFLESSKFEFVKKVKKSEFWRIDTKNKFEKPSYIRMISKCKS